MVAASAFVLPGAAFLVGAFFDVVLVCEACDALNPFPALFTIVVPVDVADVPDTLLVLLAIRLPVCSAALLDLAAVALGSAGTRAAFLMPVDVALELFSLTILASMLVAV